MKRSLEVFERRILVNEQEMFLIEKTTGCKKCHCAKCCTGKAFGRYRRI